MPSKPLRPLLIASALGAALGLALFALESASLLRSGAIGLNIDVQGTFAALFAAVRPHLPSLLGRVALAYVAYGALAGLLCAVAVWMLALRRKSVRAGVWLAEWLAILVLLGWHRAITRPALFDDLPTMRPVLGWLVDHGEPWHPMVAGGLLLLVHLALGHVHHHHALRTQAFAQVRRGLERWASLNSSSKRRLMRGAAGGLALALGVVAFVSYRAAPTKHPLIVVIGIDALRPDRLSLNGNTRGVTPNVDAFLRDATVFDRAYASIAQTEPGWRSMLTARFPHRAQVRYPLTAESRWEPLPTFAGAFSEAGFSSVFHTDCSRFNFQTPAARFDEAVQPPRGAVNFLLEKLRYRGLGLFADNALGSWLVPEFVDNRALAGLHNPIAYVERLADDLVDRAQDGPTLFAFHATAAHFPGDPVYPFYRRYVDPEEPLSRRLRMFFSPISAGSKGGWHRAGSEALYDELIAQADFQFGELVSALKQAGLYDSATIVLFSDHGESFHSDRSELGGATPVHGARLSDEENHVVLGIKLAKSLTPALSQRERGTYVARVSSLVRLVDVGPTLLALHDLAPLGDSDGVSLLPELLGSTRSDPLWLYAETGYTHAAPEVFTPRHRKGALRSFEAYRVRPDGVVEVSDEVHADVIAEKDIGAFDGTTWIVRVPMADGTIQTRCTGECPAPALEEWLDGLAPLNGSRPPIEAGAAR